MTRELLLLRHGKSDWGAGLEDFYRPLKDRGKRGAQRVGVWLARQEWIPDLVISSPAERALVTAEKTCKAMGMDASGIRQDKRIYAADVDDLLAVLGECQQKSARVMLVGHNPGLEELLLLLTDETVALAEDGKLMPTATLARLQVQADWPLLQAGCARLLSLTRPDTLPKKFPYPAADGKELRDRPAYYYTQSSVIPYRMRDGEVEVLVIASSKKNHLVIPKGIREPGLSPQASAAKEALEEAGVEGEVAEVAIGSYRYEKWGASCSVSVYPMKVIRMVPDDEWEERHRGRQWLSIKKAARQLKQAQLGPMLKKLEASL